MPAIFAAEGGYQDVHPQRAVSGPSWSCRRSLRSSPSLVGFYLAKSVMAQDEGSPKMQEIAKAIQEGACAYLKRQFKTIAVILIPVAVDRVPHVDGDRQAGRHPRP